MFVHSSSGKIEQNLEGFVKARSNGTHCKSRNGGRIRAKGELLVGGFLTGGALIAALVLSGCSQAQLDGCASNLKNRAKSAAASAVPTEVGSAISAAEQLKKSAAMLVDGKSLTGTLKVEGKSAFYELTNGDRVYVMYGGQFLSQPILAPKGKELPVDATGNPTPTVSSKLANGDTTYRYYKGVPVEPEVTVPANKQPDEVLAKYLQDTKLVLPIPSTVQPTIPVDANC